MSRPRSVTLRAALAAALVLPFAGIAQAQTPPAPSATAQPQTTPPAAAQPQTTPPAAAQPQMTPSVPAQPQATAPANAQPQTSPLTQPSSTTPATAGGARAQGSPPGVGLPAPPVPFVLPAIPDIAPGFSAPLHAIPNGELIGVQQQPFVGLALRDAIAMALQRNTDLAVAQSNRRISNYQIVAAQGAYDVRFQLVPAYSHSVTPAISSFQAGPGGGPVTQDTAGVTAGVHGVTQQGTQYRAGIAGTRVTSDSTINSYNPFYQTALQFSLTQPLGRGRAIDQQRLQLQLARTNASIQTDVALVQASNAVVQVSNAYYDLVAAWRNVAIQAEGLRNAQTQAASNARLAARGAVAPTDIVEANTQVNVFEDNVFSALKNVQRLQTQLKSLILGNPGDPVWLANLVPTTAVALIPDEPPLDALVVSAIANRPEIAQLRAARENANSNLAFARDQSRPQLDLALGYTSNGFAGNPLSPAANPIFGLFGAQVGAINALIARSNAVNPGAPPIAPVIPNLGSSPSYQNGGLGRSISNLLDNRFPMYSAQLTLEIPLGDRTAKADYAIAQEQARQVSLQETAVLQRIRSEAVNAIQGLREAQYRVIAAKSAREASQRVLLGEQRRFGAGTSTTFLVLQRQLDVANQQGRELQAQTDLDKAIVELNRVSGGLFTQNGIDAGSLGGTTLQNATPDRSVLPPATSAVPPVTRHIEPTQRKPL